MDPRPQLRTAMSAPQAPAGGRAVAMTAITATLHAGPVVGFDEPFAMLQACHARVQRSLDLLLRLGEHLDRHGADAQAAGAAADVMRYFDLAGPLHHQDEEQHVLPRLAAAGQAALAQHLYADHLRLAAAWARWRVVLGAVARGIWEHPNDGSVRAGWRDFAADYAEHVALEEAAAFPAASAGLEAATLAAMGREMAARRQSPADPERA